jgi:hypothetical protein
MESTFVNVLEELRSHLKVSKVYFKKRNELHIVFTDTYNDLIIPLDTNQNGDWLRLVFYKYLQAFHEPQNL